MAFAFINGGERIRIDLVQPGSLAERSGLRVGDLLIEVNGRKTAEVTEAQLGEIIRGWGPVTFVLDRSCTRTEIKVAGR